MKATKLYSRFVGHAFLMASPALCAASVSSASTKIPATMADSVAKASYVSGKLSLDRKNSSWNKAAITKVKLAPQKTIRLNDKKTNAMLKERKPQSAEVRVLHNNKQLAVLISWSDVSESAWSGENPGVFGDGVAIQFPQKWGKGIHLPYIGMGNEGNPVDVYQAKSLLRDGGPVEDKNEVMVKRKVDKKTRYVHSKDVAQKTANGRKKNTRLAPHPRYTRYVAAGFGSLTKVGETKGSDSRLVYDKGTKTWHYILLKKLPSKKNGSLVPFAVAIWDGAKGERGGNKLLSSWKFIALDAKKAKAKIDSAYLKYLAYTPGPKSGGGRGKTLMSTHCVACHRFAEFTSAPEGMAPNLSNIGDISHPTYLRESIMEPSRIVLRNLHKAHRYAKSGPKDPHGAYGQDDTYSWSATVGKGNKQSKMPPYSFLTPEQVDDIIAYMLNELVTKG